MFPLDPDAKDEDVRDAFLAWIVANPGDLGLDTGLTQTDLDLVEDSPFRNRHDWLTFFRFRQRYRGLPVHGPDALVHLETHRDGALAWSGAIVDGRPTYAGLSGNASANMAAATAKSHVAGLTGIPASELTADHVVRVAVPEWERVCWRALVYHGGVPKGMLLLSTQGQAPLAVLDYDSLQVSGLDNPVPIVVRGEDPATIVSYVTLTQPANQIGAEQTELSTGASLLGSTVDPLEIASEPPQLATERVVLFDLLDNVPAWDPVAMEAAFPAFNRLTDPAGEFLDDYPSHGFFAQRAYWYVQSSYDLVDQYMAGHWDSIRPWYGQPSLMPPGTFEPRILVAYRGGVGFCDGPNCVTWATQPEVYPGDWPEHELDQLPPSGGAADAEILATIGFKGGSTLKTATIVHETGHAMDMYLGPGPAKSPLCPTPCTDTTCDEDTSDEADPLSETIAQLWSMILIRHLFAGIGYEDVCTLPGAMFPSPVTTEFVHGPTCTTAAEDVRLMWRADSPECVGIQNRCDKPDGAIGHKCNVSEGYRVASLMQAFWELANGRSCDPAPPFDCAELALWPPGCDTDPMIECTAPLDLLIPAFAYAQRLQPDTYQDLIGNFVQYVACNYGDAAYQQVNAVLCHHGATECGAPAPATCEDCGNGVIEGGEECDGLDWFPYASCEALGFDGGILACDQCVIDYSGCTFAGTDTTAGGGGPGGGPGGGGPGGGGPGGDNDVSGDATGDDGGGGGCECRTSSRPSRPILGIALVLGLLGLRRRRAAVAAAVSVAACGPTVDDGGVGTSGADTTSAEASTVATGVGSETTASTPTLVPEDWIGTYHSVGSGYGEVRYTPIPTAFLQFEIRGDGTCALENWHCAQTDPMAAVVDVFGCWFEDGFVRVQPSPGSYYEEYQYVDFYLGPECGMLHEVTVPDVDDYPPLPDGPSTAVWFRGRLCIVQNCDPVVAQDPEDQSPWIYDFCPGEPRDCPCPETGTSCE